MLVARSKAVGEFGAQAWEECDWRSEILGLAELVRTATSIQTRWLSDDRKLAVVFITDDLDMRYRTVYASTDSDMRPLIRLMNMFMEARTYCHPTTTPEQSFVSVCLTATTQATGRAWRSMRHCRWDDVKYTIRCILTGEQEWRES